MPVFLGVLIFAAPADAKNSEEAKVVFDAAMRDMSEGNYEKACPGIAKSLRLDPLPGTAFTLAVCESRRGRVATAQDRFRDFLRVADALPPKEKKKQSDRIQVAEEQIEKLGAVIPMLTIQLGPGAPAATVVKRNDEIVDPADLGVAVRIDPGAYTLSTSSPGVPTKVTEIIVDKGERKLVVLGVLDSAPNPVADATSTSGRTVAGIVIGGMGLAGVVAGGVMTGLAFAQKKVLDAHCGTSIGETSSRLCDQTGIDAAQNIGTLNLAGTIAFTAGGVGLGLGIVLVATAPKSAPRPDDAGRWIHVGVLAAGPTGAMVGVRGNW